MTTQGSFRQQDLERLVPSNTNQQQSDKESAQENDKQRLLAQSDSTFGEANSTLPSGSHSTHSQTRSALHVSPSLPITSSINAGSIGQSPTGTSIASIAESYLHYPAPPHHLSPTTQHALHQMRHPVSPSGLQMSAFESNVTAGGGYFRLTNTMRCGLNSDAEGAVLELWPDCDDWTLNNANSDSKDQHDSGSSDSTSSTKQHGAALTSDAVPVPVTLHGHGRCRYERVLHTELEMLDPSAQREPVETEMVHNVRQGTKIIREGEFAVDNADPRHIIFTWHTTTRRQYHSAETTTEPPQRTHNSLREADHMDGYCVPPPPATPHMLALDGLVFQLPEPIKASLYAQRAS